MDERLLRIDEHGALKISAGFWLGVCVLARYWVFAFFLLFSGPQGAAALELFGGKMPWIALSMEVPALVGAWAAGNRKPSAGVVARAVWRITPVLMAMAAFANTAWYVSGVILAGFDGARAQMVLAGFVVLDLCVVWSFAFSPYYKALFKEFPSPE